MKLNVTQVLKSFNDEDIKTNTGTDEKPKIVPMTLRICMTTALMHSSQQELQSGADANNRMKRFILAQEIHKNEAVVLSLDELKDLKDRINSFWPTPVVAAALMILDPDEAVKIHNSRVQTKTEEKKEKKE